MREKHSGFDRLRESIDARRARRSSLAMASTTRWNFPTALSRLETMVCKRLTRTGRLFAFLRKHRHELFDMPRGNPPKPPALLAMVTLLQAYERKSDAAAVEEAVFDRRWQMVLDCIGTDEPIRMVELARETGTLATRRFASLSIHHRCGVRVASKTPSIFSVTHSRSSSTVLRTFSASPPRR